MSATILGKASDVLGRATDKIIDQLAPEELAKYTHDMAFSQAERVRCGDITSDEVDKQNELFSQKHLTFRDPGKHIQYLIALCRETNIHMAKALGEEHLRYIDSEIQSSELVLVAFNITNLLCDDLINHTTDDVSIDRIKTALGGIEKCVEAHSKKIDSLKEERAKFLNHERWNELGVYPDIKIRESMLNGPGT